MITVGIDQAADIMTDLIIIMIVAIMTFDGATVTTQEIVISIHRIAREMDMNRVAQGISVLRMSVVEG